MTDPVLLARRLAACARRLEAAQVAAASAAGALAGALGPDASLARAAEPRVIVLGAFCTGKSALVNRLVGADVLATGPTPTTQALTVVAAPDAGARPAPDGAVVVRAAGAAALPWAWVDTPGSLAAGAEVEARAGDGEACVLVLSPLQPFHLDDERRLTTLRYRWDRALLVVAVGRADLLSPAERDAVSAHVREGAARVLEGPAPVLFVSARSGEGVDVLVRAVAERVVLAQRELLGRALGRWRGALDGAIAAAEEASRPVPRSGAALESTRLAVLLHLEREVAELKRRLPRLSEAALDELTFPGPARELGRAWSVAFSRRVQDAAAGLSAGLDTVVADTLGREVGAAAAESARLAVTRSIGSSVSAALPLLAGAAGGWAAGAAAGAAAGLLGQLLLPIPVLGAALGAGVAGSLFGAAFAGRSPRVDRAAFRQQIAEPALVALRAEFDTLADQADALTRKAFEEAGRVLAGRSSLGAALPELRAARAAADQVAAELAEVSGDH